jgi:dihydrofolate synthase / folylpolyglutamate synthase
VKTYTEAIQFLYNLRLFGAKFGLENTLKLASLAGNPQKRLRFIHVAGTNGKGSTCAMLESIYRRAGLRVGLFTSPHLVAFGERIQVDRQMISESEVIRLVARMQAYLEADVWRVPGQAEVIHPTFFEVVTVLALVYFAEHHCDLVVWETGLGGRLDATNIVHPLASVITNIQLDHQQWLGNTLAAIAFEKAGIIKPGVPVITAAEAPEALEVIQQVARERQAPLIRLHDLATQAPELTTIPLPLKGEHQRLNAALAMLTVRAIESQIPVSTASMRAGLEQVQWAGRLQVEQSRSGQTVVLDGAHNPAGAEALKLAFERYFPGKPATLILGILRDKDWQSMCRILAPLAARILVVPVHSERTTDPQTLEAACHALNPGARVVVCHALDEALCHARQDPFLVIAGSLYLVGEALELLHLTSPMPKNERGLNEWTTATAPVCG